VKVNGERWVAAVGLVAVGRVSVMPDVPLMMEDGESGLV
jgi:hypothetical protein